MIGYVGKGHSMIGNDVGKGQPNDKNSLEPTPMIGNVQKGHSIIGMWWINASDSTESIGQIVMLWVTIGSNLKIVW